MNNFARAIDETKPVYGLDYFTTVQSNINGFYDLKPATETVDTKLLFQQLVDEWKTQTAHQSFVSRRIQHPAYSAIIGMGKSIVPLILEEMEREQDHWFHALLLLTGENPIPEEFDGTLGEASDIWVRWGQARYAA